MTISKFNKMESIALILMITINHIILYLPKIIISDLQSSSAINIIYISLIALLIVFIITKLLKKFPYLDILDISKFLGGKFLKILLGIILLLYFIFINSMILRNFSENLKIIYFQKTPIALIVISFIIAIIATNSLGIRATVRANLLITPIVLFSLLFIYLANSEYFYVDRLFPLLGTGFTPTFLSGISNLFAFGGIIFIYLLPPYLEDSKEIKKISTISIIFSAIYLFFSVVSLLLMFPFFSSTEQVMPLYLLTRYIEFGRFFQRLDAIFLLIWILSVTSYLSIVTAFILEIFKKITNIQHTKPVIWLFCLILFDISLIPKNLIQIRFLSNSVYKYLVLSIVFLICPLILILANLKLKRQKKKAGDTFE